MITKKDIKGYTERELLELVEKAKGHTGNDFKDAVGAEFSYATLIDEITTRGGKNGWYFGTPCGREEKNVITLVKQGEAVRKTYTVDGGVAKEWGEFIKDLPVPSVALSTALSRFMDDYRNGRVEFRISCDK